MEFQEPIALNRPLVGAQDGSVRPCIARRLLCAESMAHPPLELDWRWTELGQRRRTCQVASHRRNVQAALELGAPG
jgi:hypothetical protein